MHKDNGYIGNLVAKFQELEIVPLIAFVGILLGVVALIITPKEEDPQIDVTFANIIIPFPGASPKEVEQIVTIPAEQEFAKVAGVKHVYSVSQPGQAVLNVRFKVGVNRDQAIGRLYNSVFSTEDWLPAGVGVGKPLVKPKGIDDVPIVMVTLWSDDPKMGAYELAHVASSLEGELKSLPGTRNVYTIGSPDKIVQVALDPERLAAFNMSLDDLPNSFDIPTMFEINNYSRSLGDLIVDNRVTPIQGGTYFMNKDDVENLVVGLYQGNPIYIRDIATVTLGPATPKEYVWYSTGLAANPKVDGKNKRMAPAVTIAIAKKSGENAVAISERINEQIEAMKGFIIPENVNITITRDDGKTAEEKSNKLLMELLSATFFVVLLVFLTMGWREGVIVGAAVVITLAFTIFGNYAWGFTLNRVSLFALIFAIGILVDDAIVVVENIHRHMNMYPGKPLREIIPGAVNEIGLPTVVATFAIVFALMPMAFITGLMGPYMEPIPINSSTGMVISLVIAFLITPWLANKVLRPNAAVANGGNQAVEDQHQGKMLSFFQMLFRPFLSEKWGGFNRKMQFVVILLLIIGSLSFIGMRWVVLKMLPFDNKSDFQIMLDMPEGSTVEHTSRVMDEIGEELLKIPEIINFTGYAGTHSPVNFNGLVRQYYQRSGPNVGDIQVNLSGKTERERLSHDIARDVRQRIKWIANKYKVSLKVVESPAGPPVAFPIVAEVYGPEHEAQLRVALKVLDVFNNTDDIVDTDTCIEAPNDKIILHVDRDRASQMDTAQMAAVELLSAAISGRDVSYLHAEKAKYAVPIRLELEDGYKSDLDKLLGLKLRNLSDVMVSLSDFVSKETVSIPNAIYHKDLKPYVYVLGDTAGELDSPLYGMWDLHEKLKDTTFEGNQKLQQTWISAPDNPFGFGLKWDGEWQVTYETFRDMGIAYLIGLIFIYLLLVAYFRSYLVPIIIMVPIPLTIIGVMPGHALLNAQFTATSMIGMLALAGIIVRNSILLVDFINQELERGTAFKEAIVLSGAVRAKPIFLTAISAMLGAFFILSDPIFNGLAISLIFGLLISTLLTLLVIPLMYYSFFKDTYQKSM